MKRLSFITCLQCRIVQEWIKIIKATVETLNIRYKRDYWEKVCGGCDSPGHWLAHETVNAMPATVPGSILPSASNYAGTPDEALLNKE